jgi:hypothetical protein
MPVQNLNNYVSIPENGLILFINAEDGQLYVKDSQGGVYLFSSVFSGGGSSTWGSIGGDIYDQLDLQQEFDTTVSISGAQTISGAKVFANRIVFESGANVSQGLTVSGGANVSQGLTVSGGATVSGAVTISGGNVGIGTVADAQSLLHINGGASINRVIMDANNGVSRIFSFRTANSQRWAFRVDGTETGSETGSDWQLRRYNDSGVFQDAPMSANRGTGVVNINKFPTVAGSYYPSLVVYQYTGANVQVTATSNTSPSGFNFLVPTAELRNGSMIQVIAHYVSSGAGTGSRNMSVTVNGTASSNGIVTTLTNTNFPAGRSYIVNYFLHYFGGQLFMPQSGTFNGYGTVGTSGTWTALSPSGGGFTIYSGAFGADATSNLLMYSMKVILNY